MGTLSSLKPSVHLQRGKQNPNHVSRVSTIINSALENSYLIPSDRVPALRPSSFPKCSVIDWMKLYRFNKVGHLEQVKSFSNEYFAGVGTKVHEIIQHYMGTSEKVYGNWRCTNTDCSHGQAAMDLYDATGKCVRPGKITAHNTTDNICPECGRPMHYEELEITMRGITGHVDCVLVLDDDKWWVVDYKTTLKSKVYNKKLPETYHLDQLRTYAYILKFEYNLPIAGMSLIYLPRDNPFYMFEHREHFTKERHHKRAYRVIRREQKKWRATRKTLRDDNISHIIDAKPCSCKQDYEDKINWYNPCPMLKVCFNDRKLQQTLNGYKKYHDRKNAGQLIAFRELVQETINNI